MRRAAVVLLSATVPLVLASGVVAQTASTRVTVPSPTAASLGKFGDVPVSLFTGVPDISIPLFTVKGKTLELPIALRYNAGGIKVEEIGGWAGLGWALDAGGTITRTVRGLLDESGNGYLYRGKTFYDPSNWNGPSIALVQSIGNDQLDGEPDDYFFSFAGRSGRFAMGPVDTSGAIVVQTIPDQALRIEPNISGQITSFIITTEDGTRYTFGAAETTTDYSTYVDPGNGEYPRSGDFYNSSWQLTEIRSPGGDLITLYYSPHTVRHRQGRYDQSFHQVSGVYCALSNPSVRGEYETYVQRLDSIKAAAQTIKFVSSLRSDALNPTTGAQQEYELDKIIVTTPSGTVVRQYQFNHDYFPGNRLRLTSVAEQDASGVSLPPYTFTYDPQSFPSIGSFAQDHWGYYDGRNDTTLLPTVTLTDVNRTVVQGANRDPNPTTMQVGVLKGITYPTGGSSLFTYQANDYGAIGGDTTHPKVAVIRDTSLSWEPGMGTVSMDFTTGGTGSVTATLTLSVVPSGCNPNNEDGCPIVGLSPGFGFWQDPGPRDLTLQAGTTYTLTIQDNSSTAQWANVDVQWADSLPTGSKVVGGLRVSEIRDVDAMGDTTVRKYRYRLTSDTTRSSGIVQTQPAYVETYSSTTCSWFSRSSMSKMPLGAGTPSQVEYSEVTVQLGASGQYGTTHHTYRSYNDAMDDLGPRVWPFARGTSYEWMRGQEIERTESNAAGQVQRRTLSFHAFPTDGVTYRSFRGMAIEPFSSGLYGSSYYYNRFQVISAWTYQDSVATTTYDETGSSSFVTGTKYVYGNPHHLQLTEVDETNSDGTRRITHMSYAGDYASTGTDAVGAALSAMQGSAHMLSQVMERWVVQKVGNSERLVQGELTTFKQYLAGQILPYQRFILNAPGAIP